MKLMVFFQLLSSLASWLLSKEAQVEPKHEAVWELVPYSFVIDWHFTEDASQDVALLVGPVPRGTISGQVVLFPLETKGNPSTSKRGLRN